MKKIISILLSLTIMLGVCLSLVGCGDPKPKPPVPPDPPVLQEPELDTANAYTDNFDNIDYKYWRIMNSRWGGTSHGGVIPENVGYTADGALVITANGSYYAGSKKGTTNGGRLDNGRRTGGAITSHKALTPGVFSARMKVMPRFGATTAFWTFFNDGEVKNNSGTDYNSEIDFELAVNSEPTDDFSTTMCTNWTGVESGNYQTQKIKESFYHNDGQWHEYTFKWMTNPMRVDYLVDGRLVCSSYNNVPTYAAQINFGVWFAGFAGTPDFETDYCYVDWFKYTPYKGQHCNLTSNSTPPSSDKGYPKTPTIIPEKVNLVANGGFENPVFANETADAPNAWKFYEGTKGRTLTDATTEGAGIDSSKAIVLQSFDEIQQVYSQIYPGYKMDLSAMVKHSASQSGKIIIQYLPLEESILGSEQIIINSSTAGFKANEFYKISKLITVPKEVAGQQVKRVRICFVADEKANNQITIDNIFMNHVI